MEADSLCRTGHRIRILNSGATGFARRWTVGSPNGPRNGDTITINLRGRYNGSLGAGSIDYAFRKNGNVSAVASGSLDNVTTYTNNTPIAYTLSGFSDGDTLDFVLLRSSADKAYYLEGYTWALT